MTSNQQWCIELHNDKQPTLESISLIREVHLDYNEEDQKLQVKTNQYN